jgi:RNA polymerase sigma-70 factor (ECF subfamily)
VRLLVTMASNKLASRSRRELRQRRDIRRVDECGPQELQLIQDARPAPSTLLAGRELLEQFRAGLTDEERQLAALRGEGLDWNEIAERVGGKAQARRVQLARGVERVTQQLGLDCEDVRLVSAQRS